MLPGRQAPVWAISLVRAVAESPDLRLAAVVLDERHAARARSRGPLHGMLDAADRRLFSREAGELALTDAGPLLDAVATVRLTTADDVVERLRALDLEVVLTLVDRDPSRLASCARRGVLFHRIGIAGADPGATPAFAEFANGDDAVGISLVRLSGEGERVVALSLIHISEPTRPY